MELNGSLNAGAEAARRPHARIALEIKELQDGGAARWDAFVTGCAQATFFHRAGWKTVIERAFGHRTHFLYAERSGAIEGVLPLGHIRSRLFGNALISTPFCVYGGVAADNDEARNALESAAILIARDLSVDYLELRNRTPRHPDWPTKNLYVTFRKSVHPIPEKNFLEIPRKQRAMVRKGIGAGLRGEIDMNIDRSYEAYAHSLRRLGTPVLCKRYFHLLKEVFGDSCEVLTVTRDDRLVSSVLSFYFRNEVLPYYGGGTAEARHVKGNDFMYWELMRRACEREVQLFDYGRSKRNSGSYRFKKHWGFAPEPLYYEYQLFRTKQLPEINPVNPRYRLLIAGWKRLPLSLSKLIGPCIARYLG